MVMKMICHKIRKFIQAKDITEGVSKTQLLRNAQDQLYTR
jgi:hypothetical protein